MKLDVLPNSDSPWYRDGLNFTCTVCGNCCTGGPGYVWISEEEIARLSQHLGITPEQTVEKYCRTIGGKFSLKERRQPNGEYDCVFLTDLPSEKPAAPNGAKAKELKPGDALPLKRRGCSIYAVRPLQCRTWPFWDGNMDSRQAWERAGKRCHGIDSGSRHFTRKQIDALRTAKDWPASPPTSAKR